MRAFELCKRLAQRHEITIISGKYPGAREHPTTEGLRFHFEGSSTNNYILSTFCYAVNAFRFLRKNGGQADIIIEEFAPWNPIFPRFASRKPVVLHLNHREGAGILKRWYLLPGLPFYLIEKFYPRFFGNITALSEETRKKFGVDALILPAGIDEKVLAEHFLPAGKEDFLFFAGRLHIRNKGLDTLLEAMRMLPSERLVIAGRGPDEEKLRRMQKELFLENVEFAGFVSENKKMELMRKAKLFILPSRFEGFGIVLLESAAGATPAIVSGIPELGFAARAGFAVNFRTDDAKDLAEKIGLLGGNGPMRRQMGANGLKYAANNTWNAVAEQYEHYLKKIVL